MTAWEVLCIHMGQSGQYHVELGGTLTPTPTTHERERERERERESPKNSISPPFIGFKLLQKLISHNTHPPSPKRPKKRKKKHSGLSNPYPRGHLLPQLFL